MMGIASRRLRVLERLPQILVRAQHLIVALRALPTRIAVLGWDVKNYLLP